MTGRGQVDILPVVTTRISSKGQIVLPAEIRQQDRIEAGTLFGLEHHEVANIAFGPTLDETREDVRIAINNALNNLTGYPHRCSPEVWHQFIPAHPDEVRRILKKWKRSPTHQPFRRDFFEEME